MIFVSHKMFKTCYIFKNFALKFEKMKYNKKTYFQNISKMKCIECFLYVCVLIEFLSN